MAKQVSQKAEPIKRKHTARTTHTKKSKVLWSFPLDKLDLIYIGIGLGIIILGYILMATGISEEPSLAEGKWNNPIAVTIAPILLIIGYCIIIPLAILRLFNKSKNNE